jgi:hypothetical protein
MKPRKQSDSHQQGVVEFPGIVGTDSTSNENPATQQVVAGGKLDWNCVSSDATVGSPRTRPEETGAGRN